MSIESLTEQARIAGEERRSRIEGIEVIVVTTDPTMAVNAAPLVAAALFPDRRFGEVLHVDEPVTALGFPVVVRDLGVRHPFEAVVERALRDQGVGR